MKITNKPQEIRPNEAFTVSFPRPKWFPDSLPLQFQSVRLTAVKDASSREPVLDRDGRPVVYWDVMSPAQAIEVGDYVLHLPEVVFEAVKPETETSREQALEALSQHMAAVLTTAAAMIEGQPKGHVTVDLRVREEGGVQRTGLRLRPGKP